MFFFIRENAWVGREVGRFQEEPGVSGRGKANAGADRGLKGFQDGKTIEERCRVLFSPCGER